MAGIKPGDIVARRSYGGDIFFKVKAITVTDKGEQTAILRGLDVRLLADAPLDDLELRPAEQVLRYRHNEIQKYSGRFRRILQRRELERDLLFRGERSEKTEEDEQNFFEIPGKVLHIDGDEEYLEKCLHAYKQLNLPAQGYHISEDKQKDQVTELLKKHTPNILILTGHDGFIKEKGDFTSLDSYRNSKHFAAAVRAARALRPSHDDLVIIAGACQSHYEVLIEAGATFASSPQRVLIHAYDPVFIAERIAFTSIEKLLTPREIIKDTVTGIEGIGGVEICGRLRLSYPVSPY
ncbi:MAG: spore coat assemly protein [Clostridia bacterium]|nr:spore coat assemly protein [Clostridia bacterium]